MGENTDVGLGCLTHPGYPYSSQSNQPASLTDFYYATYAMTQKALWLSGTVVASVDANEVQRVANFLSL